MKSKRWKRRNRHTRRAWIDAYKLAEYWTKHEGFTYIPYSPMRSYISYLKVNTTPRQHQTQLGT